MTSILMLACATEPPPPVVCKPEFDGALESLGPVLFGQEPVGAVIGTDDGALLFDSADCSSSTLGYPGEPTDGVVLAWSTPTLLLSGDDGVYSAPWDDVDTVTERVPGWARLRGVGTFEGLGVAAVVETRDQVWLVSEESESVVEGASPPAGLVTDTAGSATLVAGYEDSIRVWVGSEPTEELEGLRDDRIFNLVSCDRTGDGALDLLVIEEGGRSAWTEDQLAGLYVVGADGLELTDSMLWTTEDPYTYWQLMEGWCLGDVTGDGISEVGMVWQGWNAVSLNDWYWAAVWTEGAGSPPYVAPALLLGEDGYWGWNSGVAVFENLEGDGVRALVGLEWRQLDRFEWGPDPEFPPKAWRRAGVVYSWER